jgi:hypothetical protein
MAKGTRFPAEAQVVDNTLQPQAKITADLRLVLLTGRKTGKSYRQPVSYVRDGAVLLTPGGATGSSTWPTGGRSGIRPRQAPRRRQARLPDHPLAPRQNRNTRRALASDPPPPSPPRQDHQHAAPIPDAKSPSRRAEHLLPSVGFRQGRRAVASSAAHRTLSTLRPQPQILNQSCNKAGVCAALARRAGYAASWKRGISGLGLWPGREPHGLARQSSRAWMNILDPAGAIFW